MSKSQLLVPALVLVASLCHGADFPLKEGDLVFQSFRSDQTEAVELATSSPYAHIGMILWHDNRLMVYEAFGSVKFTAVDSWIKRDQGRHFVVRRLKNANGILTTENLAKLESVALTFDGRLFDFDLNWSDERIYCSELIWKIYDRALKIDIGSLRELKDFDLSSPEVQNKLKERFPRGAPLDETVISPQDIFQSPLLTTVYEQ